MPRCARRRSESGIYHIMIRGANKQEIFHDFEDQQRFLETLKRYKKASELGVFGWCLMGNHVHLLLREGNEAISNTMRRIGVSYVWFYNQKYLTSGHLFQDRFNSEIVDTDDYLKTVIRYIHQNPVKAGLVKRAEDWEWSSCRGYYGMDCMPLGLLNPRIVLNLFAEDFHAARILFKEFNQAINSDRCLEMEQNKQIRLTDEEARKQLILLLEGLNIAQVKSLPKAARDEILRRAKTIDGVSQRQLARILGISPNLIFKA